MPKINSEDYTTKEYLLRFEGWARDGLTDKQIAELKIGINEATFCRWKKRHPSILQALKNGKEPVDYEVENLLLKRARGYEYEEVTTEIIEQPDGTKRKHIKKVTKMVIPDTTAQIFWLKNRRPDKWRDRPEFTDESALTKLDNILAQVKQNAIQQETE